MIKARPIAQEVYSCLEWVWARLLLLAEARSRNISSDICAVTAPPSCDGTVGIQVNFIWVPRNCESLVNKMVTSSSATQTFFWNIYFQHRFIQWMCLACCLLCYEYQNCPGNWKLIINLLKCSSLPRCIV